MYLPEDFTSMEYDDLLNLINVGNISININIFDIFCTSSDYKKYILDHSASDTVLWSYYLYLRARNIDGDIVDLFGGENPCRMLGDKGCKYTDKERPSLGLSLIPEKRKGEGCVQPAHRYLYEVMYDWLKHQKTLEELVRTFTNKTTIELIGEQGRTNPYWRNYYNKLDDYIDSETAFKIESELKNLKIDENINVKKLILK